MLQVYQKVEKNLDNPYGTISIKDLNELNKPFLICLSAQDTDPKSVFGIIKEGARAARVNTTDEMAAGFKIDEFPVAFLGLKFTRDDSYQKNYEEIVDSLIYPFLTSDSKSVESIKKKARKINLMTYCDGTLTYTRIEKRLEEKLQNAGFSETDIQDILSQFSLVAIGTMVDTSHLKANSASFIDVNDSEIYTQSTPVFKNLLQEKQLKSLYGHLGNSNNVLYIFEGSGNHSLKEYFLDSNRVKSAISSVLANFLENSIQNEHSSSLVELSSLATLEQLEKYDDETKDPVSLLNELDHNLNYYNAPRYTPEEAKMRRELDTSYKMLSETKTELEKTKKSLTKEEESKNLLMEGIRQFSSETTFYQVLVSAKMWQQPSGVDILQEKSDKAIREEYKKLLEDTLINNESGPKL